MGLRLEHIDHCGDHRVEGAFVDPAPQREHATRAIALDSEPSRRGRSGDAGSPDHCPGFDSFVSYGYAAGTQLETINVQ